MGQRSLQGTVVHQMSSSVCGKTDIPQTTFVDNKSELNEHVVEDEDLTDSFVALDLHSGATTLSGRENTPLSTGPGVDAVALQESIGQSEPLDVLRFVPYYSRANRKGKGHMRVGLRQWHRWWT